MSKIGRNAPCPCGSGKKYKKCHGSYAQPLAPEIALMMERRQAEEQIRTEQQGQGRPIVATQFHDHQFVAVANRLYYSKNWKFFPDFLFNYIKDVLGVQWGSAEQAKPHAKRHPILQWAEHVSNFQKKHGKDMEKGARPTGAVYCYLGLAYNLYLLKHNVDLQKRLVNRLRDIKQFQGAYYELVVANCLIRAGFELKLENETDAATKHCEYFAVSKRTGKKYWVEAKMRSVRGFFGKTDQDGMAVTARPVSKISEHLHAALAKPAEDARIIFIDINGPPDKVAEGETPNWVTSAFGILDAEEQKIEQEEQAYVFVTNISFHRSLDDDHIGSAALAHGLGMPDFGKPGEYRISEIWRHKQKHKDAHGIIETIRSYPNVPMTFDGSIPVDDTTERERVKIGERYIFPDGKGGSRLGEVTTAIMTDDKKLMVGVSYEDGTSAILTRQASDEEFRAYKMHPDAYFGAIRKVSRNTDDPYELFEWLVEAHERTPKETILKHFEGSSDIEELKKLSHEDLVLTYCERVVANINAKHLQKQASERC